MSQIFPLVVWHRGLKLVFLQQGMMIDGSHRYTGHRPFYFDHKDISAWCHGKKHALKRCLDGGNCQPVGGMCKNPLYFLGVRQGTWGHWFISCFGRACEDVAYKIAHSCCVFVCPRFASHGILDDSWSSDFFFWWSLLLWSHIQYTFQSRARPLRISDQFEIYSASWLGC